MQHKSIERVGGPRSTKVARGCYKVGPYTITLRLDSHWHVAGPVMPPGRFDHLNTAFLWCRAQVMADVRQDHVRFRGQA